MSLGREILTIKIKISKDNTDIINVRERDEPHLLAERFCHKHKLSKKEQEAITFMIDKNLDVLVDEELSSRSPQQCWKDFYAKGMDQQAKVKAKIDKIRSELKLQEVKEFTFTPSTSPKSRGPSKVQSPLKVSNRCLTFNQDTLKTAKNISLRNSPGFSFSKTQRFTTQAFEFQPRLF